MATAHLIFGYLGAGKTTLARHLEVRCAAVRFTPDEWMARLFGEDPPAAIFEEKASAILDIMQPLWTRCLTLGVDVVLDHGFWRRTDRDRARDIVRGLGATALLYEVTCPEPEARRRVAARGGHLYIAPATFDLLRPRFEPLDDDEERIEARSALGDGLARSERS